MVNVNLKDLEEEKISLLESRVMELERLIATSEQNQKDSTKLCGQLKDRLRDVRRKLDEAKRRLK